MNRRPIRQLQGIRDVSEGEYFRLRNATERLQHLFSLYGYRIIDTPLLEETELFLRKAGGEIGARLYTFTDPGGHRVSLRPEFTSSLIRKFIQEDAQGPLPLRWQYSGSVFRYEASEKGAYRQFTQVGAELLGATGPESDAEIISLAWYGIDELDISGHQLHIGHLGVIYALLRQYNLSERAKDFLIGSMMHLASGEGGRLDVLKRGKELGLLEREKRGELKAALEELDSRVAQSLLQASLREEVDTSVGQRTSEEIFNRFLRKVRGTDNPAKVEEALNLLANLSQIKGSPNESLSEGKSVARSHGLDERPFDQLERLMETLQDSGLNVADINLDFGLARGIAYYSGVIFEVLHPSLPSGASLGGGGRYDGLVRALGGSMDVPAFGFAYSLERLLEVVGDIDQEDGSSLSRATLLVAKPPDAYSHVLRLANELRSSGRIVQIGLGGRTVDQHLEYAKTSDMERVVVVNSKGQTKEYPVRVKV